MSRPAANVTLVFILIAYLALGTAYALQTPAWQAPDEPAHYNYIQFIAEQHALPILQKGEYDQAYLAEFTRTPQNVASLSIDPLRYEDYAPPLYYLLAAPIYALTDGWIIAIRLFSVALGGALVVVAYLVGAEAYPGQLVFALGGAAFVAFVPQHLAMMSAVNNDSLAELLIALTALQSMRLFQTPLISRRKLIGLGVTLGLGLLTKATFYYTAVPIAVVALAMHALKKSPKNSSSGTRGWRLFTKQATIVFVPALAIGAVWWIRNLSVYGGFDVMGLARHNAVVVGQPTTAQWLSDYGAGGLAQRFLATTYRSFWGQFGWMSTPMPDREYLILGLLAIVALIGWIGWLIQRMKVAPSGPPTPSVGHGPGGGMKKAIRTSPSAVILVLWFVMTLGGYLYYNLTFVQHQGRYLFPALIPIGLVFAIGWWQVLSGIKGLVARLLSRAKRNWSPWLEQAQLIIFALIFVYLARLDLVALQRYIIPTLRP
jgi:4-amino-4-deoxy-L-arabinose transferase-like glycosyltransferase